MRMPKRFMPDCMDEKKKPTDQENRLARKMGGRRVPGSGATEWAKGDVSLPQFLVEAKQTVHGSLSVKKAWLTKISREALAVGKVPALAIEIQGGDDDPLTARDWIAIPAAAFRQLTAGNEE
jgi:hypothetical protein